MVVRNVRSILLLVAAAPLVFAGVFVACGGPSGNADGGLGDGSDRKDGAHDGGGDGSHEQKPDATFDAGFVHPDGSTSCGCTAQGLVCNADGSCAPCTTNAECIVSGGGTTACQIEQHDSGNYQHCVACTATVPCPNGQVCDVLGIDDPAGMASARTPNLCYPDCRKTPGTCAPGVSYCSPDSGLCGFGCLTTENGCAAAGLVCNVDAGACVQCLTPADCPVQLPGCVANLCGNCVANADCPMGQACDPLVGLCHCASSSECALPAPTCYVHVHTTPDATVELGCGCILDAGACPMGTRCNRGTGQNDGGQCLPPCGDDGGPNCAANGHVCHPDSGLCGPCTNSGECADSPNGTICVTDGGAKGSCTCQEGVATSCPSGSVCSPPQGCTVSCLVDGGSCAGGSVCDKTTGACRGCLSASDCKNNPQGTYCNSGDGGSFTCICRTPADCLDAGGGCSTQLQQCGLCDDYEDCPASNPGCNSQTASCGSCSVAGDCPTSLPACGDAGTCGS